MDLVLFGIQGSGKGTQARKLAAEFGYDIFETGAELRAIVASGTELGNAVKSYIDEGKLAPLEIVMEVVERAVQKRQPDQKILFDGIPRDLEQMRAFDEIIDRSDRSIRGFHIRLPIEVALTRVLGRAAQEGRADDANEEAIRRRMEIFQQKTMPVIAAYRERGILTDVDGDGSIEDVYAKIKAAIL